MQGNCDESALPDLDLPPSHAPLRPLKPGQCLLLANNNLFEVNGTKLWIDNLHIRLTVARDDQFSHLVEVRGASGELWMTNMSIQGNGDGVRDCWACGLYAWEAGKTYVSGVLLTHGWAIALQYIEQFRIALSIFLMTAPTI